MNRIDRYISGLFWGYFLGSMMVLITIFLAVDAMSVLASAKGVSGEAVLSYYLYYIPEIFTKMLPVLCLLASVMVISTLNKANELVALFASGMSLFRIATPVFLWVFCLSGFGYYVADQVLPKATRMKNFVYYNQIKKEPGLYTTVKTDRIWYRSKNSIFNIKTLSLDGNVAQGLTLYFFSEGWDLLEMITAKTALIDQRQWKLHDGSITVFSEQSNFPLTSQFKVKKIEMTENGESLKKTGQTSEVLSQDELNYFIKKNKESGLDTVRYEVDYHAKFGFAAAGLVMCLMGIPLAVGKARSGGTIVNLGVTLVLVFGYWILLSSALTLGNHGHLSPVAAAWSPNLVMSLLGWGLLLRLNR